MDCIFCKIAAGEITSQVVFENEWVFDFRDINPQAPVHVLVIPRVHIDSCDGVNAENSVYLQKIFEAIPEIAQKEGLANGYRVITNCGKDGCQSVGHLHFHVLGGKKLPEQMA